MLPRPVRTQTPGPGQESVWDYPRPPAVEPVRAQIRVELAGEVVACSTAALRVLETSGPPVYYLPPRDVRLHLLEETPQRSFCEWKGVARYWSLRIGATRRENAAWSYPTPTRHYRLIADYLAFYPARMDACFVGDERARPQPGVFYGGWVTSNILGPFKGEPGSEGW